MTRITDPSPASILQRLRNLGRTQYPNIPANLMLMLYAQQGLLGRLEASPHADRFVLKGALSLFVRYGRASRPTQDIDLAASGLPNTLEDVARIVGEIAAFPFADGLTFDIAGTKARRINEALTYPGAALELIAALGPSRATVQLDVSFGNVVTPAPVTLTFPPLLLDSGVAVRVYPLETVLAEKLAALIELGETTTRLKDVYDLHVILSTETFEAATLSAALRRSFAARRTPQERIAPTLGAAVAGSEVLAVRWGQYRRRSGLAAPDFPQVMAEIGDFFRPLLIEGRMEGRWHPEGRSWLDGKTAHI